ncbi:MULTISPECIES: DUF6586 family protein [Halomonadaceae]|uniref:DUF6586 family protein n=1 Tax=Halomonadaceae TaxID=28256 RepID=UPI0015979582|nr:MULTISPECIES: DUF6586 family protein [unclassified Halomonas]QJQ94112.1 hypothetical protein HIO72_01610 [Halomonas sp. PA5]
MTPRGRTNQLLYQAELLLDIDGGTDEHADARRAGAQEGALALAELALNAALRELTEHARLPRHEWRLLLGDAAPSLAELERLREEARSPQSWLAVLLNHVEALHSVEGASRRRPAAASTSLIATAEQPSLRDELRWCLAQFKAELNDLRETSVEW